MKMTGFVRTPLAALEFTREEVNVMIRCSQCHYDGLCKSLSKSGGLLFGWANRFTWQPNTSILDVTLSFRDLDLLSKVVEVPPPDVATPAIALRREMYKVLVQLNAESKRINAE